MATLRDPVILDLSVWNGSFNPATLKANAHAVILRCQYGTYEDTKFRVFRELLETAEIPWTPYLFWLANVDPVDQINKFMELTGHYDSESKWQFDGKFGVWVDIEKGTRPATMSKTTLRDNFEVFITTLDEITCLKIGVYTAKYWWDDNMADTNLPRDMPIMLWVAHWGTFEPIIPKDWARPEIEFTLHQYSADHNNMGSKFGISSPDVDLSYHRLGLNGFNKQFGLDLRPLEEPVVTVPESVRVNTKILRLRDAPWGNIIGETSLGKTFYPDGIEIDDDGHPWFYIGARKKLYLAAWLTI